MTARQVWEAVLIEMNKVDAPSLLLEDFNYLFNKAINQYINKRYNIYDMNQQSTDDIRVLKSTAILKPHRIMESESPYGQPLESGNVVALNALYGATYEVNLPADYLHVLNCICIYRVNNTVKCYNAGSYQSFAAQRLTSDSWPIVLNNWYLRPSYRRPYYFLHNVNTMNDVTTTNNTLRDNLFGDSIPTNPYNPPTGDNDGSMFGQGADISADQWKYSIESQRLLDSTNGTTLTLSGSTYTARFDIQNHICLYASSAPTVPVYFGIVFIDNNGADKGTPKIQWVSTGEGHNVFKASNTGLEATISGSIRNLIIELAGSVFSPVDSSTYTIQPYSNFARTINLSNGIAVDAVEKPAGVRLGNTSPVRLEVRYGRDDSVFELELIHVDYIKTPQFIRLTPEQLDLTIDTSLIMEFPDYVCQEIINELVHIVMENTGDPRLQTHVPVSQSVAQPAQQQAAAPQA